MRSLAIIICLGLASGACSGPSEPNGNAQNKVSNAVAEVGLNQDTAAAAPAGFDPELMTVVLRGDGIIVETPGRAWPVKLDHSTQQFVERAFALFGTPERTKGPDDCPAGELNFLEYPNQLQLAFQDGKFAGYWADEHSLGVATLGGIKPGSPRTSLGNAPYQEASFGKIVTVDGAFAILDDAETKVTDIYAGAACIYD